MTAFTIGLIAAALWLSVMVGVGASWRSSINRPDRSIRRFRINQQTLRTNLPVVVRSLSQGAAPLGSLAAPALATAHTVPSVTRVEVDQMSPRNPFHRTKDKASSGPLRPKDQDSRSGPHLFSDLSSIRDESASVRTVKISTDPLGQQFPNGKELWESDAEVLVRPDPDLFLEEGPPKQDPSANEDIGGITAESMNSEPPASSSRDADMNDLLGWIKSEQELPSLAETPAVKKTQSAAKAQSAATQTMDSKEAASPPVGQASDETSSRKASHPSLDKNARRVGDITYVLVDDEGKPLLD